MPERRGFFQSAPRESWVWPVLFAWMSLFALGLVDNARGPVFPDLLRDFELSDTVGSFFFLTASLASLVHNILFFPFLSRANPKHLVGIYTLIMGAGALCISQASSFAWTLVASALLGLGFGGLGVGQNAAVQQAPAEHRQRAMGLLHAMYGISSFTAPLLISGLALYGWRLSLALLSLPSLFVGILVLYESWRSENKFEPAPGPSPVEALDPGRARWFAATLIACLVVAEISISSRMALLARRDFGVSLDGAGVWLAAYFAAMTFSRLALGVFRTPASAKVLLYWALAVALPCLVFGFLPLGLPSEVRLLSLVLFGFPIAMGYPLAMTRLAEVFGLKVQSVTSLCLILQSAAAMAMHFVLGWGADRFGLFTVLGGVSIGSLLGATLSFWGLESSVSKAKVVSL